MTRLALMRDRFRDALISLAVAWAGAVFVQVVTHSLRIANIVGYALWLPLFVVCRIASRERDRRASGSP